MEQILSDVTEDQRLPEESDSQAIGQEAVQAFTANHPRNWRPKPTDGDTDFGVDILIQVVDENQKVSGGIFHGQIKGSYSPQISADGETIAVVLKIKTLNYYARISDPIMLIFADLSSGEHPKDCEVYWLWVSEELHKELAGRSDFGHLDQASITIKIPVANKLDPDFNVLSYLAEFRKRKNAAQGFIHAIDVNRGSGRSTVDTVRDITTKVESAGESLLSSFSESTDSPWLDPPKDSLQASLHNANSLLRSNQDVEAENVLNEVVPQLEEANCHEKAEYHYLLGRVLAARSDDQSAVVEYEKAHREHGKSGKYASAYFETKFRLVYPADGDDSLIEEIIGEFPAEGSSQLMALKARLHGAVGDYETAAEILQEIDEKEAAVTKALIEYLKQDWLSTIDSCESALTNEPIKLANKTTLQTIRSRAYFYSSIAQCEMPLDGVIPPFGMPGTDLAIMEKAWEAALETLDLLRQQNWPTNSEYIVDIVGAIAPALNRHKEILYDLRDLSRRRPNIAVVHEHLARLAALANKFDLEWEALEALENLKGEGETIHFKIHALYSQHRYRDTLSLAQAKLLKADQDNCLHSTCLGMAALCAEEVMEPAAANPFVEALESRSEWAGDLAIFQFVSKANGSPLERDQAVAQLIEAYRTDSKSRSVQDNLFDALQADVPESAELCIEIAENISKRRLLSYRELVHLSQAHVTLSDWPGLLSLADRAIQQYGHLPRIVAIKAVALDGSGDAAGALNILEQLIAEHPDEELAIRSYVNICIRTGFHENAVLQLESLFNAATDRAQRLVYLRQLFSLRYSLSPGDPNLVDLAWRYGQIDDTAVEEEEGIFLQLFIAATHNDNVTADQDRVRDFQKRADAFFAHWPESSIIRRFELPGKVDSSEFISALEQAVGITPEGREWFKTMEAQLSRGELVTPYCWRPRRLLRNVANVPHMWHITQNSSKDAREYHFSISTDMSVERLNLSRDVSKPPLFDLTTLLVLYDLGILKFIFSVFQKIAVPVETVLEIQNLAHPLIGGYRTVVGIRDFLRANVDRVLQPSGSLTDTIGAEEPLDRGLEEIKELAAIGQYSLYLDDSVARQYAKGDASDVTLITTLDLLEEYERREILTAAEVAEKLASLTRWNVGAVIKERYFFSAIPASIGTTQGIESLIDVLMEEGAFRDLVDGVWDFKRDYKATLTHLAAILADVARSAQVSSDLVAAIWAIWQIKSETRGLDVDPMHHRATVFVRTVVAAKGDVNAVKKLWDAYVKLVERQFGDRMDEKLDMQSRQLVGAVAAEIVQQSDSPTIGDELLDLLLSPYESGISERDWVNNAYVQKRLELEKAQNQSD